LHFHSQQCLTELSSIVTKERNVAGVPQGSVLGPLLFLIYVNALSLTISKSANPILFADDRSIVISNTNAEEFKNSINSFMIEIINWFQNNLITLNCNKTHFLQFSTKKHNEIKMKIFVSNTVITNINSTRFLGLIIDSTLSWKDHIVELTSKINKVCYAIRTIKPLMSLGVLKSDLFLLCTFSYVIWYYFWGQFTS
jgi:hypothetical protein